MKIQTRTLTWGTFLSWLLLPLSLTLVSCSWWHDDQEGCEATRRVRFVYDMNMLYADAFAHEVKTVTLHALIRRENWSIPRLLQLQRFYPKGE